MPGDDQLSTANGVGGWTNRSTGTFNYDAQSTLSGGGRVYRTSNAGGHTHSGTTGNPSNRGTGNPSNRGTNSQGSSATNANLPPYYALAYIIQYSQGGDVAKGEKGNRGQKGDAGVATKGNKGNRGDSVKGSKGDNVGGSIDYAHFRKSTNPTMVENINVSNTAAVPIKFDIETFKGSVFVHSNTSNPERVSVTGDGIYNITVNIGLEDYQEVSDRPAIALYKNGTVIDSTITVSSRTGTVTHYNAITLRRFATLKIVHTLQLVNGDYIEIRGFRKYAHIQTTASVINTYTPECEFIMTRSSGAVAASGSQGIQGIQGPQGFKGNKGDPGSAGTSGAPIGSIIAWPTANIPPGWRIANGNPLSRAAYPELFAVLGTTYGAPDGNTFYIPDCQSRFLVGVGWAPLGGRGGSNTATLSQANIPSHFHYVAAYQNVGVNPNVPTISSTNQVAGGSGRTRWYEGYNLSGTGSAANAGRTSFVGSGAAFNITPLYQGVYWIIRAGS